jgi:hypothetical protein
LLRWAPITVDDPAVGGEVSFVAGAQTYMDARFGEDSQELDAFVTAAIEHGISPNTIP